MNKGSEVVGTPDLPWFGQWGLRPPSSFSYSSLVYNLCYTSIPNFLSFFFLFLFLFLFFLFFSFPFFFFLKKKGGKRYELMEILPKIADIPWPGQG